MKVWKLLGHTVHIFALQGQIKSMVKQKLQVFKGRQIMEKSSFKKLIF